MTAMTASPNPLLRYWHGEGRLAPLYWGWGVAGSILLAPEFRGRGVMTQAMAAAMDRLGSHLRYYTEVLADNDQSLNLFTRLGFRPRFVTLERTAR